MSLYLIKFNIRGNFLVVVLPHAMALTNQPTNKFSDLVFLFFIFFVSFQLHVDTTLKLSNGLTWHLLLPIVAVGGDKAVHLWAVESI